jgi:hypothetical protein
MTAVQDGFALEEIIYKATLLIPDLTHSMRENDIRAHFGDQSLNGVDHWIQLGNTHVLIQDKWKETMTQQEVSQFLQCADRIQTRLPSDDIVYLIWASKKEPTANSLKSLQEKKTIVISCSLSIEALARNVVLQVNQCFDTDSTPSLQAIPKVIAQPMARVRGGTITPPPVPVDIQFDDTDEGKRMIEELKSVIKNIHENVIRKLENAKNTDGIADIYTLMTQYFPVIIAEWSSGKFTKIDYNAFLKAVKNLCWPTRNKHLQSRYLFYYVKVRKISSDFANFVNDYEMKRKALLGKKSVWAKGTPTLKCSAEPISEAEYKGAVPFCEDAMTNIINRVTGQRERIIEPSLINAFWSHQCTVY